MVQGAVGQDAGRVDQADREEIVRVTQGLQRGSAAAARFKDAELLTRARQVIASVMRDPDSVLFRGLTLKKAGDIRFVCGEYNAKNGFGAYVGYRRFVTDTQEMTVRQGEMSPYILGLVIAGMGEEEAKSNPNPAIEGLCR
jgi:hypothetical protein